MRKKRALFRRFARVDGSLTSMPYEVVEFLVSKPEGPFKLAVILLDNARQLLAMDSYERRALSRRKFAISTTVVRYSTLPATSIASWCGSIILIASSMSDHRHAPAVRQDRCANRLKVTVMDISPIKTQRDYRNTLKAIEGLMAAKRNTPEGDRLDVLVTLVEAWERKHYPFDLPDPVEAIKYHMDQNGLQPRDLIPFIGSRNRVHEVLNRRRSLTLKMIWRLHEGLGIPAESLIKVGQEQAA
jgi:HTH-type transcriptional regulator / antitoxin HigA